MDVYRAKYPRDNGALSRVISKKTGISSVYPYILPAWKIHGLVWMLQMLDESEPNDVKTD